MKVQLVRVDKLEIFDCEWNKMISKQICKIIESRCFLKFNVCAQPLFINAVFLSTMITKMISIVTFYVFSMWWYTSVSFCCAIQLLSTKKVSLLPN